MQYAIRLKFIAVICFKFYLLISAISKKNFFSDSGFTIISGVKSEWINNLPFRSANATGKSAM